MSEEQEETEQKQDPEWLLNIETIYDGHEVCESCEG